jgi:predicted nuclease of predicted toxin-antitoxin system
VKLLLDANLSPRLVDALAAAGFEVRHVDDVGLLTASDEVIFDFAAQAGDVLVTADSDFSMLLAARGSAGPSVVLLRHVAELSWQDHLSLLVANLPTVTTDLSVGAVVSLSPTRLAVRRLPILGP